MKYKSKTSPKEIAKQENEIAELFVQGNSIADISTSLNISIHIVYNRIAKMKKENRWPYVAQDSSTVRVKESEEIKETPRSLSVYDTQDIRELMNLYIKKGMYAEGIALIDSYGKAHALSKGAQKNLDKLRLALEAAQAKQDAHRSKLDDLNER